MAPLSLDAQTGGSVGRGLLFAVSLVSVLLGVVYALARHELLPLLLPCIGIGLFIFLLRTEPPATYAEYVRIDDGGFTYTHAPGNVGRVSRYTWSEIVGATLVEDPPGISLSTTRGELGGVPIYFGMSHQHARMVVQKVRECIHGDNAA